MHAQGCFEYWKPRGTPVTEAWLGVGRTWFDLPMNQSRTSADVAMLVGAYVARDLAVSFRAHVQFATGPTTFTSVGIDVRRDLRRGVPLYRCNDHAMYFVAVGPAFGHMKGVDELDALVVAVDARVGVRYHGAHLSLDAMPGHSVANDSTSPAASLNWLLRVGLSVAGEY